MNYRGSYRKLLENSKAAMMAAIEIYNKPSFQYRDECVVILLLNAWELYLKALLSKNKKSIFYAKRRKQPYRTLSWQDALTNAKGYFPTDITSLPIQRNLELLGTYRDNAVHFYNAESFGVVLYALAQTCIKNFRDLLEKSFEIRLEDEINWQLLPLGIRPPLDIVSYISSERDSGGKKKSDAVRQFLSALAEATAEIKNAGGDTGRLLTVFNVKLESVKKIGDADVIVGVKKAEGTEGPLSVIKTQDPNITHPLRQKDVVNNIGLLHGKPFTPFVFQAILWKYNLKENLQYCWKASEGVLTKYSNDVVTFIDRLTVADIEAALKDYKVFMRSRSKRRKSKK
ncbi:DUF3644 domain-containing protein [candidate division WS5 bacterium]|uniref:DUF3644 domain-containing protein n=1 Tax=candidate division WS5 bacterium TaxID=2093353 RepID=A0A419DDR5_9BACT|nr:MAG: DUF3644 domain-containing protein [candidate division WS5 bacterium]